MKKEEEYEEGPDYEIKWWKDWLEADVLKRGEMVEKLPFTSEVLNIHKIKDKKMEIRSVAMMLNSFFEDLESAMYTKIRLEAEKKDE